MKKNELGVGSVVFIRSTGKMHKIIAASKNTWVLLKDCGCESFVINKRKTEPLVCDVYSVGDKVKSHHNFTGEVTGFEVANNRVVTISSKIGNYGGIDGDRVRYAYRPQELINMNEELAFELNKEYVIEMDEEPRELKVRIMEHPSRPEMFILYAIQTGRYLFSAPRDTTVAGLGSIGICNYRKVGF